MARVVKEAQERRAEILDAAQVFFYTKGYDETSIQDIIDAVKIAKGTFYHHFESKADLLDALIERLLVEPVARTEQIIERKDINALEKFQTFYREVGIWKMENKDFFWHLLEAMYRKENISLRYEARKRGNEMFKPLVARIIEEGVEEGLFSTDNPTDLADVVLVLCSGVSNALSEMLLEADEHPELMDAMERRWNLHERSLERVLGAPEGSLDLVDMELIEEFIVARPKS